ncbi:hypothetical protein C8J56DRAFT_981937 [Mycena floridula]|nr:hypothetical protein C8J56DRAFT_981937 [Mycena floridula]
MNHSMLTERQERTSSLREVNGNSSGWLHCDNIPRVFLGEERSVLHKNTAEFKAQSNPVTRTKSHPFGFAYVPWFWVSRHSLRPWLLVLSEVGWSRRRSRFSRFQISSLLFISQQLRVSSSAIATIHVFHTDLPFSTVNDQKSKKSGRKTPRNPASPAELRKCLGLETAPKEMNLPSGRSRLIYAHVIQPINLKIRLPPSLPTQSTMSYRNRNPYARYSAQPYSRYRPNNSGITKTTAMKRYHLSASDMASLTPIRTEPNPHGGFHPAQYYSVADIKQLAKEVKAEKAQAEKEKAAKLKAKNANKENAGAPVIPNAITAEKPGGKIMRTVAVKKFELSPDQLDTILPISITPNRWGTLTRFYNRVDVEELVNNLRNVASSSKTED